MTAPLPKNPPPGALRAHLELLRLPNVFTAMADVLLGFWFTHDAFDLGRTDVLLLLVAASGSLYLAGMVLNDVFDVEQDTAERPGRPIPSGRISLGRARGIGWTLLIVGVVLGWTVSLLTGDVRSGLVASALAVLVFAYDAVLKRTPLGPLAMGGCRMLNVLLGMSAFSGAWESYHLVVAGGLGLYIVGVTWLARREASASSRAQLAAATVVMMAGIALAASYPGWEDSIPLQAAVDVKESLSQWQWMMGLLAALIGWRCLRAVLNPTPKQVQAAVKNSLLSLVILDAAICMHARDENVIYAVIIAALLVPAMFLGRWIYST